MVLRKLQCSKLNGLEHIIKSKLCIENNFIIHVRHNENTIWAVITITLSLSLCHLNSCLVPTVDSLYLEVEGALWNTSRYPYFNISDFAELNNKIQFKQPNITNQYAIWLL